MSTENTPESRKVIIMGVSGSGKTRVGQALAKILGIAFYDADHFHSAANVEKMSQGIPLTDLDRSQWLRDLAVLLQQPSALVLACSALKFEYRQRLRLSHADIVFIYLKGDFDTIVERLNQRQAHYFKGEEMLRSQFETLEPPTPEEAWALNIDQPFEQVVAACVEKLQQVSR